MAVCAAHRQAALGLSRCASRKSLRELASRYPAGRRPIPGRRKTRVERSCIKQLKRKIRWHLLFFHRFYGLMEPRLAATAITSPVETIHPHELITPPSIRERQLHYTIPREPFLCPLFCFLLPPADHLSEYSSQIFDFSFSTRHKLQYTAFFLPAANLQAFSFLQA